MSAIGVIGMGTMGAPMAKNLLDAGREVCVWNRTRAREEPLADAGATRASSPRELAERSEVCLICVSDTPDVEHVLFDPETGAANGLSRGKLVIDCSTISPVATRAIGSRLADRGIGFVDAPVSGGSEGAIKGTLAIMCGGSTEDLSRARPILEIIGGKITHVGDVGAGQVAKAVNQVVIAGTYQAVAEGMVLARQAGASPRKVLEAIESGAAQSWVLTNRGPNMIADDYPLGFRMKLHRKDLAIALETARETGVTLPCASHVAATEDGLIGRGHADEDMSAIARATRRASGVPDGPME